MAEAGTLHDAFIDELRDAYDAEKQLLEGPAQAGEGGDVARAARRPSRPISRRRRGRSSGSKQVFASLDEKVRGKHCDGIAGIIEEGKSVMEEDFDDATMDACLIASGQRAEHYEMAAYGTLVAWAQAMGHTDAADLLQQILDEEKAADEKLSALAEGGINQEAASSAHPPEAKVGRGRPRQRVTRAGAARRRRPAAADADGGPRDGRAALRVSAARRPRRPDPHCYHGGRSERVRFPGRPHEPRPRSRPPPPRQGRRIVRRRDRQQGSEQHHRVLEPRRRADVRLHRPRRRSAGRSG